MERGFKMSTIVLEEAKELAETLYETLSPADRILLMRLIKQEPKTLYNELLFISHAAQKDTPLSKIS